MRRIFLYLIASLCLLSQAGCFNIGSSARPATPYFVLSPISASKGNGQLPVKTIQTAVIGVGPVELAAYLKRPDIMIRISSNELRASDSARWAEPLEDSFPRTLTENLSVLLPENRIIMYPWSQTRLPDYQVKVNVVRFDGTPGSNATLICRWSLLKKGGKSILFDRQSTFSEPLLDKGYAAMVSALSRTLESLSREVAEGIRGQRSEGR